MKKGVSPLTLPAQPRLLSSWMGKVQPQAVWPGAGAEVGVRVPLLVPAGPAHTDSGHSGRRQAGVQEVPRSANHIEGALPSGHGQARPSSADLKTLTVAPYTHPRPPRVGFILSKAKEPERKGSSL